MILNFRSTGHTLINVLSVMLPCLANCVRTWIFKQTVCFLKLSSPSGLMGNTEWTTKPPCNVSEAPCTSITPSYTHAHPENPQQTFILLTFKPGRVVKTRQGWERRNTGRHHSSRTFRVTVCNVYQIRSQWGGWLGVVCRTPIVGEDRSTGNGTAETQG